MSIGLLLPVLQLTVDGDIASLAQRGGYWKFLHSAYTTLGLPLNLTTLLLSVLLIIAVKESIGYFQKVYARKIETEYVAHLRREVFDRIINADIAYFNNKKVGDIVNSLTTQASNAGHTIWLTVLLMTASLLTAVYLFLLLIMSWQMTLLSLGVIVILSFSAQQQIQYSRRYGLSLVELNKELYHFLSQRLSGIRIVKASTMEKKEAEKLDRTAREMALKSLLMEISSSKIVFIFQVLATAAVLFIFYFAVQVIRMPLAALMIFFFILIRLSPYVMKINTYRHELAGYLGSLENVLQTLEEVSTWGEIKSGSRIFDEVKEQIQLKNVGFSYDEIPVLKDINLTVKKGEMTAIVGATGAGKSTLADLFLRFYDPIAGQITIDGVNMKEFDLSSFRSKIGYVTQDIFLFNDTVEANISYGFDSASEEDIIAAAKIANAHDFITKLPQGYQTIIGERGVKLSGGQKQRLALARALLKNPQILILDEATSHLDSESERLIQESLNKVRRNYTIIAIAHRLSTIENADKIVVLEDGKIVEEGTHEELLRLGGHYAKYYALQLNVPER